MDSIDPLLAISWYIVFVLSAVAHEASHALAALKLGDPTAYLGGQVSLDPLPHMRREPMGMVIVPVLSLLISGWPIGWASAPYNPAWEYRYPKRAALMALAGPLANLILVVLAGIAMRIGLAAEVFHRPEVLRLSQLVVSDGEGLMHGCALALSLIFSLNLLLFVLNLIPVPPLDGSSVLPLFLSADLARRYLEFMRQGNFAMIGLVAAWLLLGKLFGPAIVVALRLLYA